MDSNRLSVLFRRFLQLTALKKTKKKTGSASSLSFSNVFVSQECESSRNRLINLEARRQSRPRSRRSAWDTDERSAPDKKKERKLKWNTLSPLECFFFLFLFFRMKDNLSRRSGLNLYFSPPSPVLYLLPERESVDHRFVVMAGLH